MSTTKLQTTAILKTDLSGSTPRFRGTPEADLAALLREHRALVERLAAAHGGRMVKPEGDGFWLAFPSVTAAALAAMSMQEELRLAQANAGEDRLAMRIVIALGDVLHQDGALVGDTVVLTTRIEAHTPPDEIYLTAAAWLAMNHAEIRTSFVSAFALKGFPEPAAVYRIEQRHRTHVIADQYVVVADLKGFTKLTETQPATRVETTLDTLHEIVATVCRDFGGVVRFSAGDAYCLTFTDAEDVMVGVERLATAWERFSRKAEVRCAINIAVHKGTLYAFRSYLWGPDLNLVFGIERATARGRVGTFLSGRVLRDLVGSAWETRLESVQLDAMPADLKEAAIYRLRYTSRADSQGGTS